ncbi:MAG: hypothetical protein JXX28_12085 [Deltaproteobacteria bacterium]|nr:hypothetical protein [Deltaproteobacteria bacterium]
MSNPDELPTERISARRKAGEGAAPGTAEYEAWYAAPEVDEDTEEAEDLVMKDAPVPDGYQGFYDLPDEDE